MAASLADEVYLNLVSAGLEEDGAASVRSRILASTSYGERASSSAAATESGVEALATLPLTAEAFKIFGSVITKTILSRAAISSSDTVELVQAVAASSMSAACVSGIDVSSKSQLVAGLAVGITTSIGVDDAFATAEFEASGASLTSAAKAIISSGGEAESTALMRALIAGTVGEWSKQQFDRSGISKEAGKALSQTLQALYGSSTSPLSGPIAGTIDGVIDTLISSEFTSSEMAPLLVETSQAIAGAVHSSSMSTADKGTSANTAASRFLSALVTHGSFPEEIVTAFATHVGKGFGKAMEGSSASDAVMTAALTGFAQAAVSTINSNHYIPYLGVNFAAGLLDGAKYSDSDLSAATTAFKSTLTTIFDDTNWNTARKASAIWAVGKRLSTTSSYTDPFQGFLDSNSFSDLDIKVYDSSTLQIKHLGFDIGAIDGTTEIGGDVDCAGGVNCFGVAGAASKYGFFDGASNVDERVITAGMGHIIEVKPGAILKSPIDGVVIAVNKAVNGYSTDWSISIRPTVNSRYIFLYDHVDNVTVAAGDQVTAGQPLAEKVAGGGVEFNYSRTYVNYNDVMRESHDICFTKYLDPGYAAGILANLDAFFTSVRNNAISKSYTTYFDDILINNYSDIYDQSKMPSLGCYATNQVATLARVGYPNYTGQAPYDFAWPVVPGVVDSENAYWFYPNEE